MTILYLGACWPTNIGNAFIDYGALHCLKKAAPKYTVQFASELPRWLVAMSNADPNQAIAMGELVQCDAIVVSGMNLCEEFVRIDGPVIKRLATQGKPIIFLGCGGSTYSPSEIKVVRDFLRAVKPAGFISRDSKAYALYHDLFPIAHNGIDCGFFVSDVHQPVPLNKPAYIAVSFDALKEPAIDYGSHRVIRLAHSFMDFSPERVSWEETIVGISTTQPVVRFKVKGGEESARQRITRGQLLISDLPEDYLNVYAGATKVYTDRVHAAVASLAYGTPVRFFSPTPRGLLFERIGATKIHRSLVKLNLKKFRLEKTKQIQALATILKSVR